APSHMINLFWVATAAVFIKGVYGSLYYLLILGGDLGGIESIAEHGAAIHLNALFVSGLGVWIYETSWMQSVLLPLAVPFVLPGYIAMQRRAAVVTLAIGVLLGIAVLYKENRRRFWIIAPALILSGAGYVAVYWNGRGTLGLPARAIKSVFAAE